MTGHTKHKEYIVQDHNGDDIVILADNFEYGGNGLKFYLKGNLVACFIQYKSFRRKAEKIELETITIHGRKVTKPMTEKPSVGEIYFYASSEYCTHSDAWENTEMDINRFGKGIFDNKEDCDKFAEAYYRPWQELVE